MAALDSARAAGGLAAGLPGTIASGSALPAVAASPTPLALPPVRFPQDEAPHHDLTEWWYYTGHLSARDAAGRTHSYGFELTFFQTLRGQFAPYYAAHFAISDLTRGQFHYDQRAAFAPPDVIPAPDSTSGFNLALAGWTARGLGGRDQLAATMSGYAINLGLTATKPDVLHGGNGIITYGDAGYSYYYSRTRMAVSGTITDHGARLTVSGLAWMDHQWGNFVSLAGAGWDWYSIQLDDARSTCSTSFVIARSAPSRCSARPWRGRAARQGCNQTRCASRRLARGAARIRAGCIRLGGA